MKWQWAFLALSMLLPSAMGYGYFVALGSNEAGQTNRALLTAYPISKVIQALLPIIALVLFGPLICVSQPTRRNGLQWGLAFGIATTVLIFVVAHLLRDSVLIDVPARVAQKVAEFGTATPARFLALAAFLSVAHSLFEEYYWRWFVYARLRQWLPFLPAALLSGITFSSHHLFVLDYYLPGRFWSAAVPFTLGIAIGGMFWAWLFEQTRSIVGPWLSHMIVDAAIMAVGYKMIFGG